MIPASPNIAVRYGIVRNPRMIALSHALERFVYERSSAVVAIAEQLRRVISERGVPSEKLALIPDCADTELYGPLPRENSFAKAHGLLDDFVVLYAENLGLVQNWNTVLYAAEWLKGLSIRFVLVGDGARRVWLEVEIVRRGLQNVMLLGYQPKERMPEIYASCNAAMIPMTRSGAADGFPSKIYTILPCGKGVLATGDRESELMRIIERARCGRVAPIEDPAAYADAVLQAFQDRDLLDTEGQRGREFVIADYSKASIARKYDELIRRVTGK